MYKVNKETLEMLITVADLPNVRARHHQRIVLLVGGCFDLVHVGHVAYLNKCRDLSRGRDPVLVAMVASDKRVREKKGKERPIIGELDRVTMIDSLAIVDYAFIATEPEQGKQSPTLQAVDLLRPDIFATANERYLQYSSTWEGVQVSYVADTGHTPTTKIIGRILELHAS